MINIVFQNTDFVVCDKPAEVLSVPAREKNDMRPCLGIALQRELNTQVFPVHRLDYEVSGLILFALNSQAHKISQRWFEKKQLQKKYKAITTLQDFKHWPKDIKTDSKLIVITPGQEFLWKTKILRGKKRSFESEQGDWAETKAVLKSKSEKEVQWELFPITGKAHQLRLELSRHGFPIHGDQLYGSTVAWNKKGIALRAVEIDFLRIEDRLGLPQKIQIESWNE